MGKYIRVGEAFTKSTKSWAFAWEGEIFLDAILKFLVVENNRVEVWGMFDQRNRKMKVGFVSI